MIYKNYSRYLLEADDDDNTGGGNTVDVSANGDNTGNDNADANNADNNQDNNDQQNNDQQNNNDNGDTDENYDIDDGGDVNIDDGDNDNGDTDTGEGDTGTEDNTEDNKLKDEGPEHPEFDKIYSQLTPQEKAMHDHELRQNYKRLYNSIDVIVDKTVKLPRTSQTLESTTNLLHTLFDFKKYILYYIKNTYENKTLIENTIEYWKYMSVLGAYKAVYKELSKVLSNGFEDE